MEAPPEVQAPALAYYELVDAQEAVDYSHTCRPTSFTSCLEFTDLEDHRPILVWSDRGGCLIMEMARRGCVHRLMDIEPPR